MYRDAAGREMRRPAAATCCAAPRPTPQASLRDFQHYQGRAAADEADAQRLIEGIARELGE